MRAALLFVLLLLSGIGLAASGVVHFAALRDSDLGYGEKSLLLHVGAVVILASTSGGLWRFKWRSLGELIPECPDWVRLLLRILFVYMLASFVYLMIQSMPYPRGSVPLLWRLRGFSSLWIFLYALGCAMCWSRLHSESRE